MLEQYPEFAADLKEFVAFKKVLDKVPTRKQPYDKEKYERLAVETVREVLMNLRSKREH